jgi:hypothetical protein
MRNWVRVGVGVGVRAYLQLLEQQLRGAHDEPRLRGGALHGVRFAGRRDAVRHHHRAVALAAHLPEPSDRGFQRGFKRLLETE